MIAPRVIVRLGGLSVLVGALGLTTGCATPRLDAARANFYHGQAEKAARILDDVRPPEKDRVLFHLERGTMRLSAGRYWEAAQDFEVAAEELEALQTYSVSKGAASWVTSDNVLAYRGPPYERTLLHAMAAKCYLAMGLWEDAAVEARRIIRSLEPDLRGNFPEDAYSRYMAGFCLEMEGDPSNAAVQYRRANELAKGVTIDEQGRISQGEESASGPKGACELVAFVMIGRSPRVLPGESWQPGPALYAELYDGGNCLGRSYPLTDTLELAFITERIIALQKTAKVVGRVLLKDQLAEAVARETKNELLGDLLRFLLIGVLEQPDLRRWESLPRWLQVARVAAPEDLSKVHVVIKDSAGRSLRSAELSQPWARRGKTIVTFYRDLGWTAW